MKQLSHNSKDEIIAELGYKIDFLEDTDGSNLVAAGRVISRLRAQNKRYMLALSKITNLCESV